MNWDWRNIATIHVLLSSLWSGHLHWQYYISVDKRDRAVLEQMINEITNLVSETQSQPAPTGLRGKDTCLCRVISAASAKSALSLTVTLAYSSLWQAVPCSLDSVGMQSCATAQSVCCAVAAVHSTHAVQSSQEGQKAFLSCPDTLVHC